MNVYIREHCSVLSVSRGKNFAVTTEHEKPTLTFFILQIFNGTEIHSPLKKTQGFPKIHKSQHPS